MAGIKASVSLDGDKELSALFRELSKNTAKKAMKRAINLGATPIVRAARKDAPVRTGTLKKAIGKRVKSYPNGNSVAVIGAKKNVQAEGPGAGKKTGKIIPYFYIHLIEGGVRPHSQIRNQRGSFASAEYLKKLGLNQGLGRGGVNPGFPANPFLDRALKQQKSQSDLIVQKTLAAEIEKDAIKLGKK